MAHSTKADGYLTGKLLVATPVISESCFEKSVIYVCAHNHEGAMGIIINQRVESISDTDLLEQLGLAPGFLTRPLPIHFGGPVDPARGFILHSADVAPPESLAMTGNIALSANIELLKEIAEGKGPAERLLALGYAGWGPGQLESEIESGSWLVVPATKDIIFGGNNDDKWKLAGFTQGIDVSRISPMVGHA